VNVNPSVHTELAKGGLVLKAAKDLARGRVCIWPEAACASGQRPIASGPGFFQGPMLSRTWVASRLH